MASYIPSTAEEQQAMLEAIGLKTVEDLYAAVPASAKLENLNLPDGLSEFEAAAATAPSYTEALDTSMPVSSQICV